jgi:DNA-binding beta-propeller fold protein YncE
VEGFPLVEPGPNVIQTHGVALSPDETEAWICDSPNGTVHVFDVTGLPNKPRQVASIQVRRPQHLATWINFSHDGRHVRVSNGAVIDAKSREIVRWIADSRYYMEIGFQHGKPMAAYPRYGIGFAHQSWWFEQTEQP